MEYGNLNFEDNGRSRGCMNEMLGRMNAILASNQIVLWEHDVSTGDFLLPMDYFQVLGLEEQGISFSTMEEAESFVFPEDRDAYRAAYNAFLTSSQEKTVIFYRFLTPKRDTVWMKDHLAFARDENGNSVRARISGYTENVTRQAKQENEFHALKEYNTKIIDGLSDAIFVLDRDFYIRDLLLGKDTVLLHPIDYLIGRNCADIFSPEVTVFYKRAINECLTDKENKEIEFPVDVDGHRYYFQSHIHPFSEDLVLAFIHDIGARVRYFNDLIEAKRKADEANKLKSAFLANMSHEIRTPLNAIVGFSEILPYTEVEEEKKEFLGLIQRNSNLLLGLINDILDLSRIESGKTKMKFEKVNIGELVESVGKSNQLKVSSKVDFHILKLDDVFIMTDVNRLSQVINNLLSNAIKNTSQGSIKLGMRKKKAWLEIYVTDTGRGIPKDKLPLIFDRFEKLNDSVQGTGLGLSISKSIVERLGGRLDAKSELGKGSTFSIYLRCSAINHHTMDVLLHRKRVLILDDASKEYGRLVSALQQNYEVFGENSEDNALNSILYDDPHLILIDMGMENAVKIVEAIRKISSTIPIVGIIEHIHYLDQQQAFQAGCNEVVDRPYSINRMLEIIERFLIEG